jgi:hypothetical protein
MRLSAHLWPATAPIALTLLAACGEKAPPTPAPVEAAAPAPAPAPAAPEPPPPPAEVVNASFKATVTRADGTSVSGKVKRVERSSNFLGNDAWSTEAADLKINAEGAGTYAKLTWDKVKSITVAPPVVKSDTISCTYSSETNPWLYECNIPAPAKLATTDGQTLTVDSGHKWRFVFDDGSEVEFWMKKHFAWEQDANEVTLETENPENYDLYAKLQQRLKTEVKSSLVTKITIEP